MTVDLGCGPRKRGDLGIDRMAGPGVDIVCDLGFDPIPLADGIATTVTAYDFLEHLPVSADWRDVDGRWHHHYPRIYLLREVLRILMPGGLFVSSTPAVLPGWVQDPTHQVPPWVAETWRYFCGHEGSLPATYGIPTGFSLVRAAVSANGHLEVTVQKVSS